MHRQKEAGRDVEIVGEYHHHLIITSTSDHVYRISDIYSQVFIPIISGFVLGCIFGDYAWDRFSYKAVLFPATSVGILGTHRVRSTSLT